MTMEKQPLDSKPPQKKRDSSAAPVTEDKTSHRQLVITLDKHSEIFKSIFDNTLEGILMADGHGRLVLANDCICEMLGYAREELLRKTVRDIHPPESLGEVAAAFEKQLRGELKTACDLPILKKDGSVFFADVSSFPFLVDGITCLVGYFRDTSERQEAERSLRSSEARFREVLQSSPMGTHMYRLEKDGSLVFDGYSEAANRILGVDCAQFMDKVIEEAFPPLAETEVPDRYRKAALEGEPWRTEQLFYEDNQIIGAFEIHAFQTGPRKMAAMFLDITDRKKTEVQLKEAHESLEKKVQERTNDLERANQSLKEMTAQLVHSAKLAALGELTAGVAHELNQPLNGIKITSQALQLDIKRNRFDMNNLDEKLQAINGLVDRMSGIIQHMRIFTRQTGQETRKKVAIDKIIQGASSFFEQQLMNSRIQLTKELGDNPIFIFAEELEIEQILLNLLSNARHSLLAARGGDKKITLRAFEKDDNAIISVEDNGGGISSEIQSKVFDPFFTTKDPGEGTGLGLSISRKIMEEHRGRIELISEPDRFTRFNLIFPQPATTLQNDGD